MFSTICGIVLTLHMGLNEEYQYNSFHPYCKAKTESNVIAGAYYNSVDRVSLFVGYEYDINYHTSIELGVASGYEYDVTPTVRVNYKNLFLMPALDNGKTGLAIGLQYNF